MGEENRFDVNAPRLVSKRAGNKDRTFKRQLGIVASFAIDSAGSVP